MIWGYHHDFGNPNFYNHFLWAIRGMKDEITNQPSLEKFEKHRRLAVLSNTRWFVGPEWRKVKGFLNCSGQFHGIKNHRFLWVKHQTYGAITDNAWVMNIWGYYMLLLSFTIQYIVHDHNPLGNPFRIGRRSHFLDAPGGKFIEPPEAYEPPKRT